MKSPLKVLWAAFLLACTPGCATIISGSTQIVSIDSNVQGATVNINGVEVGKTPFTGSIKRAKEAVVTVSAPGYETHQQALSTGTNPMILGNVLFSYSTLTSSTTDMMSGAGWEYSPNTYFINLRAPSQALSDFTRESALKAFAMLHSDNLLLEIEAGAGEHLESLHAQMGYSGMTIDSLVASLRKAAPANAPELGAAVLAM